MTICAASIILPSVIKRYVKISLIAEICHRGEATILFGTFLCLCDYYADILFFSGPGVTRLDFKSWIYAISVCVCVLISIPEPNFLLLTQDNWGIVLPTFYGKCAL